MEKSILPASLLKVVFRKETASIKNHYRLKAFTGNIPSPSSHLHQLFFGSVRINSFSEPKKEDQAGIYDDYSSYE
jgi:hypothetical protein